MVGEDDTRRFFAKAEPVEDARLESVVLVGCEQSKGFADSGRAPADPIPEMIAGGEAEGMVGGEAGCACEAGSHVSVLRLLRFPC